MSSILITGASKGIGRAAAAELARRGHRVVATARDTRTLDDLDVDQRLRLDVTDQASVAAAVERSSRSTSSSSNAGVIFRAAVEAKSDRGDRTPLRAEHCRGDPCHSGRPAADARAQEGPAAVRLQCRRASRSARPSHTRPPSSHSKPSPRHWPSRSPGLASMSLSLSRVRSAQALWTTCSPTVCPTTRTQACSHKAAFPRR